uniref:26S proteasome non-ATPase regulatory subunit 5 n=1 Tax=Corethrella appendiculata TaxID=1370023 RepID=U5ETB0_9DIPT
MSEEWCREQLENLQIKDLRTNTLNEIKNQLVKLPANENEITSKFIKSPILLDCLEDSTTTNEQTALLCDILSICMSSLSLDTTNIKTTLERSLSHSNTSVQQLAIAEIEKLINSSSITNVFDVNLIILLVKCIESDDSKVGTPVIEILVKILPNFIHINSVKVNLENTLDRSDIVRCRTYEVGVKLARISQQLLENVEYILQKAIVELDSEDILLQLNLLEILSELPLYQHGFVYLENRKVFEKLVKKIELMEENPLSRILIPGLMRFFGNVAQIHPSKIFNGYPNVINALFDCLLANDYSILPVAFDTLANLASSNDGKKFLDSVPGQKMKVIARELYSMLRNLPSELKIRLLNCLEALFRIDPNLSDNQVTCITQSWYEIFSSSSDLTVIMEYAKNSFPDIKIASIGWLKAICLHKWGQEFFRNTAGFLEYLLDRKSEFDKNVLLEKYEIIRILSESDRVFDIETLNELRKYVREGAFYVQGVTEVAIEGGN